MYYVFSSNGQGDFSQNYSHSYKLDIHTVLSLSEEKYQLVNVMKSNYWQAVLQVAPLQQLYHLPSWISLSCLTR